MEIPGLSTSLYEQFAPTFGELSKQQQNLILNLANSVGANSGSTAQFIELLLKFEDRFEDIFQMLIPQPAAHRVVLLDLLSRVPERVLNDIVDRASEADLTRIVTLLECCDRTTSKTFISYMEELSYAVVIRLLTQYARPKMCHMCAIKMEKLNEVKQLNDLVDPIRTPNTWQTDDDASLTFDFQSEYIKYFGVVLDLANVCADCLSKIKGCLTTLDRFTPIWHLSPTERKDAMKQTRKGELESASMFEVLERSRRLRDCKDWIQSTLQHAHTQEFLRQKAEAKQALVRKQEEEKRRLAQMRQDMMATALAADEKGKAHERHLMEKQFQLQNALSTMQYYPSFSSNRRHAAIANKREHELSSKLAHHDEDGVPLTAEGAANTFGIAKLAPDVNIPRLQRFKQEALEVDRRLNAEREAREAKEREANKAAHDAMNEFVDSLTEKLELKKLVAKNRAADQQARYLEERRRMKEQRRQERLAEMERLENKLMEQEEARMRQFLFTERERMQEEIELMLMRAQEKEQTLVDNFWGIPTLFAILERDDYERQHISEIRMENNRRIMSTLKGSVHTMWKPKTGVPVKFTNRLLPTK